MMNAVDEYETESGDALSTSSRTLIGDSDADDGTEIHYPTVRVEGDDIVLVKIEFDIPHRYCNDIDAEHDRVPLVNTYGYTTNGTQRTFEQDMELPDDESLRIYLRSNFPGIQRVVIEFKCHTDWLTYPAYCDIATSLRYICPLFAEYQIGLECDWSDENDTSQSDCDGTLSAYDAVLAMIMLRALDKEYRSITSESADWFRGDHFRVIRFRRFIIIA